MPAENSFRSRRDGFAPVPTSERNSKGKSSLEPRRRFKHNPKFDYFLAKVNALFWVLLAAVISVYCNVPGIIVTQLDKGDLAMTIAILFLMISTLIALYCTVWLRLVLGRKEPWEISAPYMIELATFSGFISYISFSIACWGHFGFLSLLIVPCLFLGLIMISQFIPIP